MCMNMPLMITIWMQALRWQTRSISNHALSHSSWLEVKMLYILPCKHRAFLCQFSPQQQTTDSRPVKWGSPVIRVHPHPHPPPNRKGRKAVGNLRICKVNLLQTPLKPEHCRFSRIFYFFIYLFVWDSRLHPAYSFIHSMCKWGSAVK